MKPEDNRLDDLFREKLRHFAPEPSPEVWNGIRDAIGRKKPVRRMILYRRIAVAALLAIAVITGVLLIHDPALPPSARQPLSVATQEKTPPAESSGRNTGTPGKRSIPGAAITGPVQSTKVKPAGGRISDAAESPFAGRIDYPAIVRVTSRGETPPVLPAAALPQLAGVTGQESAHTAKSINIPDKDRLLALENIKNHNVPGFRKEWVIGVHLSPAYASHTVDYSSSYARNMSSGGSPSETGVGAGISVRMQASRHWALESGVFYSRNGDRSVNSHRLSGDKEGYFNDLANGFNYFSIPVSLSDGKMNMNSAAGVIRFDRTPGNAQLISAAGSAIGMNSTLLTPGEFFQVFDFMEVPLIARYRVIDSKVALDLLGGLSTNFVVGNRVFLESTSSREYVGKTSDIASLGISGSAGFGILYPLSKRIFITIEPRASYWMSSLNNGGEVTFRPWKIGIYSGLTFGF